MKLQFVDLGQNVITDLPIDGNMLVAMAECVPEPADHPRGRSFIADEEAWTMIDALEHGALMKVHPSKPAPGFFNGVPILIDGRPTVMAAIDTARLDRRTHITRINENAEGQSHAWLPNAARFHPRGAEPPLKKPTDPRSFPE